MPNSRLKYSSEEIYHDLRDRVQYCILKPGEPINEATLIKEYNVSKTPIREALNRLSEEYLIDIYPQSGTFVSRIDIKRLNDLVYLRTTVEDAINLELAERKNPLNSTIDKYLALSEISIQMKDWRESIRLDYEFHKELYRIANRLEVWQVIEKSVLPYYTRIRFFDDATHTEFLKRPSTQDEHVAIVECIRTGDVDRLKNEVSEQHNLWFKRQYMRIAMSEHPDYFINLDQL